MRLTALLTILPALLFCLGLQPALANGYEQFSRPLAWSPDGSILAAAVPDYWADFAGEAQGTLQLHDNEGMIWTLIWGQIASPGFSPDGEWLPAVVNGDVWLFEKNHNPVRPHSPGTEEASYDHEVYMHSMPYRHIATLTSSRDVLECVWESQDALLISRGERFYGCGMERIAWPAQRVDALSPLADEISEWGMAVSPTGRLAYSAQGGGIGPDYERLCVAERRIESSEQQIITEPQPAGDWGYHEAWPVWADDAELLFQRGGWGDWSIYGLDTGSGEEQLVMRGGFQPSLDAEGRWLAFNYRDKGLLDSAEYDWELPSSIVLHDRLERSGQRYWRLSPPQHNAACPAVSADGQRLAWISLSEEGYVTVVQAAIAELLEMSELIELDPLGGQDTHYEPFSMSEEPTVADEITYVVLETGKGEIVLECHRAWAPLGYARFLELVRAGYYNGAPWFRVIDGFVAQCGIAADPAVNAAWDTQTIKDDPVIMGNRRAMVSFGTAGPDTRTAHIFINFADNAFLDGHGFAAFAQVSEGMAVADSLTRIDDNAFAAKGLDQGSLAEAGGLKQFADKFPDADYILRAYVRE